MVSPKCIAIIGATGGIGAAVVAACRERHGGAEVICLSRSGDASGGDAGHVLDYDQPETISAAAAAIGGPLDLVFVATGLLHDGDLGPEKSLRDLDAERLARVYRVNTIGPALVMRHFLPLMRRDRRAVFAAISARVGSISDNGIGGWYGYRSAKAALNQMIRTAAIEQKRRFKEAVVVGLHPGTVDTGLSEPFQGNVPDGKLFTPAFSANAMLDVLEGLTEEQSGRLYAFDGQEIAP